MFNLEVDADHCYRVGEQGILVHNISGGFVPRFSKPICDPCKRLSDVRTKQVMGAGGVMFTSQYQVGVDLLGHDFTYFEANIVRSQDVLRNEGVVCRINSITGTLPGIAQGRKCEPPDKSLPRNDSGKLMGITLLLTDDLRNKYDAGHLAGLEYGGPDSIYNLVPMVTLLNQGRYGSEGWTSAHTRIKTCLCEASACSVMDSAKITLTTHYPAGTGVIPSSIDLSVVFTALTKDGVKTGGPSLSYLNAPDYNNYSKSKCLTQWKPTPTTPSIP